MLKLPIVDFTLIVEHKLSYLILLNCLEFAMLVFTCGKATLHTYPIHGRLSFAK
jgi:hypothetical protein